MLFLVKNPVGRLIAVCDQDVKALYDECYRIMETSDYTQSNLRDVYIYAEMLREEHIYRFGRPPEFDHKMEFATDFDPTYSKGTKLEIVELTQEEYLEKVASYASWVKVDTIPRWWKRKTSQGRLFCPLPGKLYDQIPMPMEDKSKKKEEDGKTAAAYHSEISKMLKGYGIKPFTRVLIEKWMIKEVDIEAKVQERLETETPDFAKALQSEIQQETKNKVALNVIRKPLKKEGYIGLISALKNQGGVIEPSQYVDAVIERFQARGIECLEKTN